MWPTLRRSLALLALLGLVACGGPGAGRTPTSSRSAGPPASSRSDHPEVTSTTITAATDDQAHDQPGRLTPQRRARLGIDAGPGGAAPLTAQQWADPEAVACRFVLADTTYSAEEDPRTVAARRAAFTTERLAEDLATSSSGGGRLAALRERRVSYAGELLTVAARSEQAGSVTVVDVGAAMVTASSDRPAERRLRFYRLTMTQGDDGRWLVARVEQS